MSARNIVMLCALIVGGVVVLPGVSHAQVNLSINIGEAPPPPRVEVMPAPRRGYVWAPGYWRWEGRGHVWMNGHWERARPGQHWVAERWAQAGARWRFEPGHWEHEHKMERGHERKQEREHERQRDH